MHAEVCPVCTGKGDLGHRNDTAMTKIICHACHGHGYILVPNDPPQINIPCAPENPRTVDLEYFNITR